MKNNGKNQAKTGIREEALESLLHQVLREDGKVFPVSEEDIRNLECEIAPDEVKKIDPARLLARLRGEEVQDDERVVPLFGTTSRAVVADMEAMAARNGGQITEETKRQMDEDQGNAEKRLDGQKE